MPDSWGWHIQSHNYHLLQVELDTPHFPADMCGRGLLTLWMVECLINLCNRKFSSARNVILVLIPESTNNQCSGQDNFLRKFKSLIQTGQREFFTFVVAMLSGTLSSASSNTFLHAEQYFNDTTGAQLRG